MSPTSFKFFLKLICFYFPFSNIETFDYFRLLTLICPFMVTAIFLLWYIFIVLVKNCSNFFDVGTPALYHWFQNQEAGEMGGSITNSTGEFFFFFLILYKHALFLCPSLHFFPFENYYLWNKYIYILLFIGFISLVWQGSLNTGLLYGLNAVCLLDRYLLVVCSMAMVGWLCKRWNQRGDLQAIQYEIWEGIMRTLGLSGFPSVISSSHKHSCSGPVSWANATKRESSTKHAPCS